MKYDLKLLNISIITRKQFEQILPSRKLFSFYWLWSQMGTDFLKSDEFEYTVEFLKMMGSLKTENLKYDDDGKICLPFDENQRIYIICRIVEKIITF